MRRGTEAVSLSGWLAFVGPLALYIATLAPGVVFWDTGEMQTVPYILGIPHPTGFPLFVLSGWLFSHLFPIGDPAWRLSFFSALASAGAAFFLWVFVRDLIGGTVIGVAAAWAFAVGEVVWSRAVRAEVHDLGLLCTTLALAASQRAGLMRSGRALFVAALACGFGLATHPATAFALPSVVVLGWPAFAVATRAERLRLLAALTLPLALYLYLPLRSAYVETHHLDANAAIGLPGSAIVDDGMPSTPAAFWRYVTGETFHPGAAFDSIASGAGIGRALAFCRDGLFSEFSEDMLGLAVVGFVFLCIARRRVALAFALLLAAIAAFAANYRLESDAPRYAMPAFWAIVACAACGAHTIVSKLLPSRPAAVAWLGAAALALALFPNVVVAYGAVLHANAYDDARSIGRDVAARTADGSLIVATWDYATALDYASFVSGTLGSRQILYGWPPDFAPRYGAWRKRFKHVYFVVEAAYNVSSYARPLLTRARWQLAELR